MSRLPDSLNLLQQLMDNMTDNIFFKDRDHRFIMINQANARWFGFEDPQEAIGKSDFDLFDEAFARQAYEDEERIMATGSPMLGDEEQTDHDGEKVWGHVTKIPLRDNTGQIIGIIGIGRDITALKRKEIELAEANRQIEADLYMAAQLQQTFLPQSYPLYHAADGRQLLEFFHYYKADIALGGDFCAVHRLSDTRAGLLICDVMGHGVRAALVTGIIRAFAEELAAKAQTPGDYLTAMNNKLLPVLRFEDEYIFATACYLTVDVATGELTGALAGHTLPFLIQPSTGTPEPLAIEEEMPGPALTVVADYQYRTFTMPLAAGDKVLMYTDGICEACNKDGIQYGEEQLRKNLQVHVRLSLRETGEALLDDLKRFSDGQQIGDDVCLLGFALNGLV